MRTLTAAVLLASLLLPAAGTLAQSGQAPGRVDPHFVIDWKVVPGPRGDSIEGFVYNTSNQPADHMQLAIEALDEAGEIIGRSSTWVLGGVPPNNRTWFTTPVPASGAAAYRIAILSFDWVGLGA